MAQESIGTARLDIVVDTSQFDAAIASAKRGTSDMSQAAQADYTKLAAVERRRVDALVNQANTIGMTRKEQILYNAALRGVPTSILDELKTKLAATGTAAAAAGKQLNQYGVSAAQQSAALRGVPAQITDIVVSLQGGQQPLTVLLQQGGQLKDMFGGIVPAARALGSTVLGLVTPWRLAAAAVALFAVAVGAGKGEQSEFTKTLILSGNAAGQTAAGMSNLATRIADVAGARGKAVEALNLIAGSGKIAGQNFAAVGEAAVAMNRATGKALADTVQEFETLRGKPAEAIAALNEQQHFLTLEIYQQIASLERQGRTQEAAALAQRTYADAVKQQAEEVRQNLGTLETAWDAVKQGASGAWEAMKSLGRAPSFDDLTSKLRAVNEELAQMRANAAPQTDESQAFFGDGGRGARRRARPLEQESRRLIAEAAALQDQADQAAIVGSQKRQEAEKIAAATRLAALAKETETNRQKREREIAQVKDDAKLTGATLETQKKLIDQINDKYKDPAVKAYTENAAAKLLQQYREAEASLHAQIGSEGKLATWGQKRAEFEQQIADLKDKKSLTADQKSLLAQQDLLRRQLDLNVAAEKELRTKQETAKVDALRASLASTRELEQQQYADQVAGVGLGDRAQEELRARQGILRDHQRQQAQFDRSMASGQISQETYRSETALLQEHLGLRLSMQQQYFDQVRTAQGDWKNGATSALANYLDSASNVAGQTKALFSNAFQGMEDAIVRFATTGKLSFKDFATSVLSDLARIAARQAIVGMVGSIVGAVAGAAASGISAGASYQGMGGAATGSVEGMSGSWGAVAGARASGGPTAANSLYRVNELGPELYSEDGQTYLMSGANGGYVTPLKSSVPGAGSAAAAAPSISIQVNVTADGKDERKGAGESEMGDRLADGIVALVRSEITRSHKPGGAAWNARNGRA
ncbi:phage tail tape measure protein [Achromobacter sp. LC458]|uniref:phage tail tape measure protein n=1 Tax=Achromobacter sp. LC458 TaxID=1120623 RepID=UPI000699BF4B|nr:phage tail tape measure protein [Achromobacter sp. LC458]TRM51471.1 phage tail tape measure protein [Achromobacter sp. LC458]